MNRKRSDDRVYVWPPQVLGIPERIVYGIEDEA